MINVKSPLLDDWRGTALRTRGAAWSLSFSPDGESLTFIAPERRRIALWRVDESLQCRRISKRLHNVVGGCAGAECVAYLTTTADERLKLVARCRSERRAIEVLLPVASSGWVGPWVDEDRAVTLTLAGAGAPVTTFVMDTRTLCRTPLLDSFDFHSVTDVANGRRMALMQLRGDRVRAISIVDLPASLVGTISPDAPEDTVGGGVFFDNASRVLVTTNRGGEFMRLAAADVRTGLKDLHTIAERRADLDMFSVDRERVVAIIAWNASGASDVEVVNLATASRLASLAFKRHVVTGLAVASRGRKAAIALTGQDFTGVLIGELDGLDGVLEKRARRVSRRRPAPPPESIEFCSGDGTCIQAWLWRPTSSHYPSEWVIALHGGPSAQERPVPNSLYSSLLRRGIGILAPNFRGSTGFGKTFSNKGAGTQRWRVVDDVAAAGKHLLASHDARSLAVCGNSYGGYLALLITVAEPRMFAAAAVVSGFSDLNTLVDETEHWRAPLFAREFGGLPVDRQKLEALSPIYRVAEIQCPVLVVHGTRDRITPLGQAEELVRRLRDAQKRVDVLFVAGGDHGLSSLNGKSEAVAQWLAAELRGANRSSDNSIAHRAR